MIIKLTKGKEKIQSLKEAKAISIKTKDKAVYIRNGDTAKTDGERCILIPANSYMRAVDFGFDNCSELHMIASASTEIEIEVVSVFKGLHRGTIPKEKELIIDFKEVPEKFIVQNLSKEANLYIGLDSSATVAGPSCIKLPAGMELNNVRVKKTKISVIADGECEYQIIGEAE